MRDEERIRFKPEQFAQKPSRQSLKNESRTLVRLDDQVEMSSSVPQILKYRPSIESNKD